MMKNKDYAIYIEEFIVNGLQIIEIAKKYNVSHKVVSTSLSKYFGSGKWKLMSNLKTSHNQLIKKYTNLTNLKELYEKEYTRS
jgi:predicted DNA-binding protein YlxM (UPF0122 family)